MSQLELLRNQAESAVKNQLSGLGAQVRRKTSLVGEVSRLMGSSTHQAESASDPGTSGRQSTRGSGATVATPPPPARPAADGYIRVSPVQVLRVVADYRRSILMKALKIVAVIVVVVLILGFLVQNYVLSL